MRVFSNLVSTVLVSATVFCLGFSNLANAKPQNSEEILAQKKAEADARQKKLIDDVVTQLLKLIVPSSVQTQAVVNATIPMKFDPETGESKPDMANAIFSQLAVDANVHTQKGEIVVKLSELAPPTPANAVSADKNSPKQAVTLLKISADSLIFDLHAGINPKASETKSNDAKGVPKAFVATLDIKNANNNDEGFIEIEVNAENIPFKIIRFSGLSIELETDDLDAEDPMQKIKTATVECDMSIPLYSKVDAKSKSKSPSVTFHKVKKCKVIKSANNLGIEYDESNP
jgi:hypothetical protein